LHVESSERDDIAVSVERSSLLIQQVEDVKQVGKNVVVLFEQQH
jgi:hypothetical protein